MAKCFWLGSLALAAALSVAAADQTSTSATPNSMAPTETTASTDSPPITDTSTATPTANSAGTISPSTDYTNTQTTYTSTASPAKTSASTQTTSYSNYTNTQTTYTSTASPAKTSASTQTAPDSNYTNTQTTYTSTASPAKTSASTQTTSYSNYTSTQTTYTSTASPANTSASTQTAPDSTAPLTNSSTAPPAQTSNDPHTNSSTAPPTQTSKDPHTNSSTASPTQTSKDPHANSSTAPPTQTSKDRLTNSSTAPPTQTSNDPRTNSSTASPAQTSKDPHTNSSMARPTQTSKDRLTNSSTAPPTQTSKDRLINSSTAPPTQTSNDPHANSSTASATITSTTPFINISMASPTLTPHSSPDSSTSTTAAATNAPNSTTAYTSTVSSDMKCAYHLTVINKTENEVFLKLNDTTEQNLHVVCDNHTAVLRANQIFQISNLSLCARINCSTNSTIKCNHPNRSIQVSLEPSTSHKLNFTIETREEANSIVFKANDNEAKPHSCSWEYEWNCSPHSDANKSLEVKVSKNTTSCIEYQCSVKVFLQNKSDHIFSNPTKSTFALNGTLQALLFNIAIANQSISGSWNALSTANIMTSVNVVENQRKKCKVDKNKFVCEGLLPYKNYTICLKTELSCNDSTYESKENCSIHQTDIGIPGNVSCQRPTLPENNVIEVRCDLPEDINGPKGAITAKIDPHAIPTITNHSKHYTIRFMNLRYHTTYHIEVWANNSNHRGKPTKKEINTSFDDGALIGFLAFLIILTSVALIVVLWKIYSLQKNSRRDADESIELIDHDDEKQLLNVEPILAENLLDAFRSKQADESRLFLAEFQSIPRVFNKFHVKEARKAYNSNKNRYVDILPYDHNRVSLTPVTGTPGLDYINASYIDGFNEPKKYIAAQGPKEETSSDFWKMVWEQKATSIVMVTRCEEGNRPKCAQYWPTLDEQSKSFGDLVIKIGEEKWCPDYVVRKIFILHKKEKPSEREVTHIQFISWPDHGVPEDPQLLLKLRRRVNSFSNFFSGPIIVHCSAGVGRTGSYIGIDAMMQGLEAEGRVDIYGYVVKLRRQRCLMVQVEAQYILIHQALLEHYIFGDTEISLSELPKDLINLKRKDPVSEPSLLDAEFQRIPIYEVKSQKSGKLTENQSKNRSISVIPLRIHFQEAECNLRENIKFSSPQHVSKPPPFPWSMPFQKNSIEGGANSVKMSQGHFVMARQPRYFLNLGHPPHVKVEYNRVTVKLVDEKSKESENDSEMDSDDDDDDDECTKYINASFIDGYWHTESLIVTQTPLQETIADFWQMVFQKKTGFIVMLSKLKEDTEDFTEYWGEEDKTYEDVEVKLTDCNKGPEFNVRTFEIKCGKRKEARKVHQYHYHKWTDSDLPEDPSSFIKMIRTLKEKLPKHNGPNRAIVPPIVVHCSDGGKLSGMFCALWNLLDSADTENVIDVFYAVKLLRKQRLGMIPTLGQFEFLYDTIASIYPVQNGTLKSSESSLQTTVEIIAESPLEESKLDAAPVSDEKSKEVSAVSAEEKKPEFDSTNQQPAENPVNGPLTATANE